MGKASRWLMNLLLGRKDLETKEAVISVSASENYLRSPFVAGIPKIKRPWSFGRSFCKDTFKPRYKSLDLIASAGKLSVLEVETRRRHSVDVVTGETWGASKALQNAAATKIQAAFRSYLARKALHALRGLVKLQALVRGHLVRKQATATLRRMHALMAIQVRARFQRVQMADQESKLIAQSHSSRHRNMPHDNGSRTRRHISRETRDINLHERHGLLKSKKGYQNHTQFERVEQGFTAYYSGDLSISKREHQYQEFSVIRTHNNSPLLLSPTSTRLTPGRASFSGMQQDCSLLPNYMSNTESFRAKSRSQSEPKQRPQQNTKTKAKQTPFADGGSNPQPYVSYGSQEPWFAGMYGKQERSKDGEFDCASKISHSNFREFLVACEPHATMF